MGLPQLPPLLPLPPCCKPRTACGYGKEPEQSASISFVLRTQSASSCIQLWVLFSSQLRSQRFRRGPVRHPWIIRWTICFSSCPLSGGWGLQYRTNSKTWPWYAACQGRVLPRSGNERWMPQSLAEDAYRRKKKAHLLLLKFLPNWSFWLALLAKKLYRQQTNRFWSLLAPLLDLHRPPWSLRL